MGAALPRGGGVSAPTAGAVTAGNTALSTAYVLARHDGWIWTAIGFIIVLMAVPIALAVLASAAAARSAALTSMPVLSTSALTIGGGTPLHQVQYGTVPIQTGVTDYTVTFTTTFASTPTVILSWGMPGTAAPSVLPPPPVAYAYHVDTTGFVIAISASGIVPTSVVSWIAVE